MTDALRRLDTANVPIIVTVSRVRVACSLACSCLLACLLPCLVCIAAVVVTHARCAQIGRRCVLDASAAEESHCGASLWAAVTPAGAVAAAGARRGGALPPGAAQEMLVAAKEAAKALHAALDAHLATARASAQQPLPQ